MWSGFQIKLLILCIEIFILQLFTTSFVYISISFAIRIYHSRAHSQMSTETCNVGIYNCMLNIKYN